MVWKTIGFYRVQPSWYQRNIANKGLLMAYLPVAITKSVNCAVMPICAISTRANKKPKAGAKAMTAKWLSVTLVAWYSSVNKQFTGLCDCQASLESALHCHFNACFTALNLMKWHDRQHAPSRKPISVSSWKNRFFNQLLIDRIYLNSAILLIPQWHTVCRLVFVQYNALIISGRQTL